jgi:hypothetical protein
VRPGLAVFEAEGAAEAPSQRAPLRRPGGGPRVCIGKDLALAEAVGILAGLAGRFRVERDAHQTVTPWPTVTLRPRYGIKGVVFPSEVRSQEPSPVFGSPSE